MRSRSDADFARAMAGVEPLRPSRRAVMQLARRAPVPVQRIRDEHAALTESLDQPLSAEDSLDSGDELAYVRGGMSRDVLRKLRRGQWVIEDSLDLHGMNRREAAVMVADFLLRCLRRSLRCVRIVHGKGLGSKNREPVLKRKLGGWLNVRDEVVAFCQASTAHGGSGAVLVLLKGRGR